MKRSGLSFARRNGVFVTIALLAIYGIAVLRPWLFPDAFLFGIYMQAVIPVLMLFIGFLLGKMKGYGAFLLAASLGAHLGLATYIEGDLNVGAAMSLFGATLVTAVVGYAVGYASMARRGKRESSNL